MTDEETADLVSFLAENPKADRWTRQGQERWLQDDYVLLRRSNARLSHFRLLERREGLFDREGVVGIEGDNKRHRSRASKEDGHASEQKGCSNMSKKAFDKIAAGLSEALEIARGNMKPAELYVPPEINVREIRKKLNLSQDDFAAEFGFTINQIRDWEQGRTRPLGGLRAYLMLIKSDPQVVSQLLRSGAGKKRATKAA
jgi:putative transcriptional regulator